MEKPRAGVLKMERKKSSDLCRTTSPILVRKKGRRRSTARVPSMEEVKENRDVGISYVKSKESVDNTKKPGVRRNSCSAAEGRRRRTSTSSSVHSEESFEGGSKSDLTIDEERKDSSTSFSELLSTIDKEFGNKEFFSKPIDETQCSGLSKISDKLEEENYDLSLDESVPEWVRNAVSNESNTVNGKNNGNEATQERHSSVLPVVEEQDCTRVFGTNPDTEIPQTYKNGHESKNQPETTGNVPDKLPETYRDGISSESVDNVKNDSNDITGDVCTPEIPVTEDADKKTPNTRRHFGARKQEKKVWQPPPKTTQSNFEFGINYKK